MRVQRGSGEGGRGVEIGGGGLYIHECVTDVCVCVNMIYVSRFNM